MSFYNFDREDAFRFRDFIHAQAKIRGQELVFLKCPYCGNLSKDKEKFSINLDTGRYNCFRASCGAHGNMITLARDFGFSLSDDVDRYYNLNRRNDRFRRFAEFKAKHSEPAEQYCKSRGISAEICQRFELTTRKDDPNILVFVFKDEKGEVRFIKYRNTKYQKGDKGSKEWCERDCMPILFGMNLVPETATEIIITEGQFDTLAIAEAGYLNVASVPIGVNAFTWVPHCWDFLQRFNSICVVGDYENGIVTLADDLIARFGKKVKVARTEDYQGYKDANDILQHLGAEAVRALVDNAEYVQNDRIVDMSNIEYVDLTQTPKIKTGVQELDEILDGGLMYGNLVVQTGKRGDGKSTWTSNMIVNALDQDCNCMIYSGEMPKIMVKSWLNSQIVGKRVLTNTEIDSCNVWYKGRLYLYDSDITNEENDRPEEDILLEAFEEAIVRLNVVFMVIDNLMTIVDSETNEKLYRRQSKFVGKLAKLCKKYKVVIVLVAHPRKTNANELENDDVSGASEITNKADVVLNYARLSDKEAAAESEPENMRWLYVNKNRTGNGKIGRVKVEFSPDSKRIVQAGDSFVKAYLNDGFMDIDPETYEQLPFD